MTDPRAYLWHCRRPELGAEWATLTPVPTGHRFAGTVVRAVDGVPAQVTYVVVADAQWRTRRVAVTVTDLDGERTLELTADGEGRWTDADGTPRPEVEGCLDVDLGVTPATNTLPVRRLGLDVGASAEVTAAWVSPDLTLEALPQAYTRLDARRYRYRSPGFEATVEVDEDGIVADYEGGWVQVARS